MIILALLFLAASNAFAIEAEYTTFTVDGRSYQTPIPNKSTRDDYYMLHKALSGDEVARKMLIGLNNEKKFFIGDADAVRWLVLTPDDEYVTEYTLGEK